MIGAPEVSIVITAFNLADFLPATLASLQKQTLRSWEAVIIDDGSTDSCMDACRSFTQSDSRFTYFYQENKGLPTARNVGFGRTTPESKYVMFLDGDDVLYPQALETFVAHLRNYPEAGMITCVPEIIDEIGAAMEDQSWPLGVAHGVRPLHRHDRIIPFEAIYNLTAGIICSCSLIRNSVYRCVGGFDVGFGHHREDTNVFLEIALIAEVHRLGVSVVGYRRRRGQMSLDTAGLRAQAEKLHAIWCARRDLPQAHLDVVERAEEFRTSSELALYFALVGARHQFVRGRYFLGVRILVGGLRAHAGGLMRPGKAVTSE